ncbi:MAG: RsmD family RNA methyltransferase, partial [Flavobacteriales bacterium]|nr:RsmD family RNA methyltransferase [Flavobacteriales bacterium]
MRIIRGKHKGKKIFAPKNLPVRPTTDFAKEGLFNILENEFDLENVRILDLFAGTGNITYEFISRGTSQITAVDMNENCTKFILKTLQTLSPSNTRVVRKDVL